MGYCSKCGAQLYDNSAFCHSCGAPTKPSTTATSAQTGFDRLKDDKGFQDHWARRVIAYVIDVVILTVAIYLGLLFVTIPALPSIFLNPTFPFWAWFSGFWLGGIAPLVTIVYFVLADALFGRTIGKELMGLRVTKTDGKRIDLWSSFVRNISKIWFPLLIIDVAVGLGTYGDGRQKYSDRYIGTTIEATNASRIIPDWL